MRLVEDLIVFDDVGVTIVGLREPRTGAERVEPPRMK